MPMNCRAFFRRSFVPSIQSNAASEKKNEVCVQVQVKNATLVRYEPVVRKEWLQAKRSTQMFAREDGFLDVADLE